MGAGVTKTYSPVLVPKQIMGLHGDSMEGMPNGALGYVGEGSILKRKGQYDPLIFPATEALKAKGISTEDWEAICTMLRQGKGATGIGGGFSKAISKANELYFDKVGCVGCYAEYGKGQKAMVVFETEAIKHGRVKK